MVRQAVREIRPCVRHIHLHDNFGKACASYEKKQYELVATGRGDLHLPPGWGEIPMREMFELLGDYSGVVLLELRPRYGGFLPEILENARRLCAKAAARTAPGAGI
jgi:sugar phosphate isomerase/epimerase